MKIHLPNLFHYCFEEIGWLKGKVSFSRIMHEQVMPHWSLFILSLPYLLVGCILDTDDTENSAPIQTDKDAYVVSVSGRRLAFQT